MAQMTQGFAFTGSISNLSAYKMRGSDKIILRSKGGPSKKKIKTSPSFANTRRHNSEFGGRATATKWIRRAIHPILSLADFNIAGPLNALVKPIQEMDTASELGMRSICFTKQPGLLQGFQLNNRNPFDQIIRSPLNVSLSRSELSALIDIPSLVPGINFFVPGRFAYFGFTLVMGAVPDLIFDKTGYKPQADNFKPYQATEYTDWQPVNAGAPAQSIQLNIKTLTADESLSLVVSVGIRFGSPGIKEIEQLKYVGAGKILAVM
jgi:hypothetical protein